MAAVVIDVVHLIRGNYANKCFLGDIPVERVSSYLTGQDTRFYATTSVETPYQLVANASKSFQGSIVLGMGFILSVEEAQALIIKDSHNRDVLFPYLNGEDLNSRPDQSPSRWVVNFRERSEAEAQTYQDCYSIVRERVYPERITKDAKKYPRMVNEWWKFWNARYELYETISPLQRVLVLTIVSRTVAFVFVQSDWVYAHRLAVFPFQNYLTFSVLQSNLHYFWAWKYSSTMKMDLNYSPSDCFETFPFPQSPFMNAHSLETIGENYYEYRRHILLARQEGLTKTYNRFHNPSESSADIAHLRELHMQMDQAVSVAYGWNDLDLGHGFHETPQGIRYTLSEPARREVLSRLLQLNHERYEEEVQAGLHEKKGSKGSGVKGKRGKRVEEGPEQYGLL
jgi:hypothetical protein